MNRRLARYAGLGLALYVLFLIVMAPAGLLAWALARASNDAITLQAVTGTVWSGGGELILSRGQASSLGLGRGRWSVSPWWIVLGRVGVSVDFTSPGTVLKAQGRIGLGGATLRNVEVRFPASLVPTVYPPATLAGPSGDVRIEAKRLVLARRNMAGEVVAVWQGAGTMVSNINPLGDYRMIATGQGDAFSLALTTDRGDLRLSGQGRWSLATRKFEMKGNATPAQESKGALDPLLRLFGRDQGDGSRTFIVQLTV